MQCRRWCNYIAAPYQRAASPAVNCSGPLVPAECRTLYPQRNPVSKTWQGYFTLNWNLPRCTVFGWQTNWATRFSNWAIWVESVCYSVPRMCERMCEVLNIVKINWVVASRTRIRSVISVIVMDRVCCLTCRPEDVCSHHWPISWMSASRSVADVGSVMTPRSHTTVVSWAVVDPTEFYKCMLVNE